MSHASRKIPRRELRARATFADENLTGSLLFDHELDGAYHNLGADGRGYAMHVFRTATGNWIVSCGCRTFLSTTNASRHYRSHSHQDRQRGVWRAGQLLALDDKSA